MLRYQQQLSFFDQSKLDGSIRFINLSQFVLDLASQLITPEGRAGGSFADPVEAGPDAGLLDRLIAFTGRAVSSAH